MESIDDVLKAELAKLGSLGGALGGGLGGALGGGLGAKWAAGALPTNVYARVIHTGVPAEIAVSAVAHGMAALGRVLGGVAASPHPTLRAVIGAGFLNMNPAVVEAEFVQLDDNRLRITLTGTAKEGLIKQRSGEKAVGRLIDTVPFLANAVPELPGSAPGADEVVVENDAPE